MSPTCSPRWATQRTPERKTLGSAAAKIAVKLGTPLMPWQRQVLDVSLELDVKTGRLVYREVDLTVPRQSGKTTLLLTLILLRALGSKKRNIRYTAQTGSDARKKWMDDWLPVLLPSPFGNLFRPRLTNGHEALLFKNGSIQSLIATTKKTGHGGSVDLGLLDESFAHPDARLEQALKPSMITRPQPQLYVVSTAGTPEDSPYLWGKVEAGRQYADAGMNHSVAYFEWSAEDGLDPSDPLTWWSCMPALGYTVTEEAVASDFASMDLSEFERAYLNRWRKAMTDPVIPLAQWNALADQDSLPIDPVCFSYDVSPDRSSAAIGVAGKRWDEIGHVEVITMEQGTDWVAPRLEGLVSQHRNVGVVCDTAGPAGGLLADVEARGIKVIPVNAREHSQACGMLFDAVARQTVRHLGDPLLTAALDGAVKRQLGDAWAWSRRSSAVNISPLVAVTLALWGSETLKSGRSKVPVSL